VVAVEIKKVGNILKSPLALLAVCRYRLISTVALYQTRPESHNREVRGLRGGC